MGTRVKTAAMLAAMLACMVGTARADASTPTQRLAKRVAKLERANKNRLRENRELAAVVAQDESALGSAIGLLSCFYVIGVDDSFFTPPGMVDPVDAIVVSSAPTPTAWTAAVSPDCVDTTAAAAATRARARAFRHFFAVKGIR